MHIIDNKIRASIIDVMMKWIVHNSQYDYSVSIILCYK